MAFNFNWSPLIADTSRAREMLTAALNKSQKPPIIVDDILVTELNLGSVPPELEILEIGDLAEDRFRGIFKMSYSGDAYFALKTRVQANPLNTYLSTKPTFASPQPLAASSGLTIPLQITLSDIRLSGFVILVFSRQKGITLVFRNDPLESLKVSSTFDTIPFVRDYLQKEIEGQLRELFMEDLPAIIHRLSLRMLSDDYSDSEDAQERDNELGAEDNEVTINPFGSPRQEPYDEPLHAMTDLDVSSLSPLDPAAENGTKFSHKNLLRLAALTDSHRTLSLFTPTIHDSVYRAWAFAAERGEIPSTAPSGLNLASLRRNNSVGSNFSSSAHSHSEYPGSHSPSLPSSAGFSSLTGLSGSKARGHGGRRRKRHVVNLRKQKEPDLKEEETGDRPTTPTSSSPPSSQAHTGSEVREGELVTPPISPETRARHNKGRNMSIDSIEATAHLSTPSRPFPSNKLAESVGDDLQATPRARPPSTIRALSAVTQHPPLPSNASHGNHPPQPPQADQLFAYPFPTMENSSALAPPFNPYNTTPAVPFTTNLSAAGSGGILEQAWMMKMANEIARKVASEKAAAEAAAAATAAATTATEPANTRRATGLPPTSAKNTAPEKAHGLFDTPDPHHGDETPPPAYAA